MKLEFKITFTILLISLSILAVPQALGADIVLISHSGYIDISGNYHVVGEVQNVGTSTYNIITVTIDFFNSDDEIIATRFDLTLLDVLLPSRKAPFDIMLLDQALSSEVDGYAIKTTQQKRSTLAKELDIVYRDWYKDELGNIHVEGNIKNQGNAPAQDVKIVATFLDTDGKVTAAAFTYINADENTLQPKETAPFEIVLDEERSYFSKSYEITAESINYAEIREDDPIPEPPPPEPEPGETEPANIEIVYLSINPMKIYEGAAISINATAENTGGQAGTKTIELIIDSIKVDSKKVTLSVGQSLNVSFSTTANQGIGEHMIKVGALNHTINILRRNLIPPIISDPTPISRMENINITLEKLEFTVIDEDSDRINITGTTIPFIGEIEELNVASGSYTIAIETTLQWNTTYTWTINASDGKYSTNASYTFTTEEEPLPPIVTLIYPLDESTNVAENLIFLKFSLNDPNHDRMLYYISLNPGDYKTNGISIQEGNQDVLIPILLENNTHYTWQLNVTDQTHWANNSYQFTTQFPSSGLKPIEQPKGIPGDKLLLSLVGLTIIGVVAYIGREYKQFFPVNPKK